MLRHQTLSFLFVFGLTTMLLVRGLGVEDQEYSFREDSTFFLVTSSFFGEGGGGVKQKFLNSSDKNKER